MKRLIRVAMGAGLAAGSLGFVLIASPAQALGPEGCTAQGANGFVAVGTLAGTAAPNTSVTPSSTACTNPPSATITADGGGAGADSSGWTVTADTAHTAATDVTGTSCGWVANATTGFSTASGTGQVTVGQGCIKAGATVSGTAG